MIIKKAEIKDAEKYLDMMKQLDNETKNMMFEPGERTTTIGQMRDIISSVNNSGGAIFVIEDEDKIRGFLSVQRGIPNRIRHSAYVVIGILAAYRGRKLGTSLFIELEKWAAENKITRLELTVIKNNEPALKLYKKMGFKIEGTKEKAMIIDGQYIDEYYMGKLL